MGLTEGAKPFMSRHRVDYLHFDMNGSGSGMGSNEANKIAGALLGVLTLAMGVGFFANLLVSPKPIQKAGYELPEPTGDAGHGGGAPAAAAAPAEPIAKRLASATLAKGEAAAKKCASCHQFTKDGKNGQGPLLYGVVLRDMGKVAGFNYSKGLQAFAADGKKWDFEALDAFVANPKGYIAGTSMSFAGLAKPDERADLILYLRSLSDNPAPLP